MIDFSAQLENTGTTPAIGISQKFDSKILTDQPTEEEFLNHPGSVALTIGAKEPAAIGAVEYPVAVLVKDPNKTTAVDKYDFYFWGWYTYRDIFKDTPVHLTEFCGQMTNVSGERDKNGKISKYDMAFGKCTRHNCEDEECKDYERVLARPIEAH
jgi:hypothetical protein